MGSNMVIDPVFSSPANWGQGSSWPANAAYNPNGNPPTYGTVTNGIIYAEVPCYSTATFQFQGAIISVVPGQTLAYGARLIAAGFASGSIYFALLGAGNSVLSQITANGGQEDYLSTYVVPNGVTAVYPTFGASVAQAVSPFPTNWQASHAYSNSGSVCVSPQNEFHYGVVTSGTSGSVAPSWPTTFGATVVDHTTLWQCNGKDSQIVNFAFPVVRSL